MVAKRERLARRRRAVGLTQERLAELLNTDRSTVHRWESGGTTPLPEQQRKLARALGVTAAELADLLEPKGHSDSGGPTERVAYALRKPAGTDPVTVTHLWRQVSALDERYDRLPSTSLLAETAQVLGQIGFLGEHARPALRRDLLRIKATAATLLGQLVWDASQRRDYRTARRYFEQAGHAAREANDPVAEGHALLRTSYLALYGEHDPIEGLRLTERTTAVTRMASDVLTGLARLHAAEAHAMLGEARRCEAALAAAETSFGKVTSADTAAHLFSPTQFNRLAGSCHLFLGDYHRAQRILDQAATAMTAPTKSRAIVLGNLSLAYLHRRDLDSAVVTLHEAIDVLETNRGGGGLNVVSHAVRKLRRWRSEPAVQDVYDRVLSLMTAAQ